MRKLELKKQNKKKPTSKHLKLGGEIKFTKPKKEDYDGKKFQYLYHDEQGCW